jgi:hypothetical protein
VRDNRLGAATRPTCRVVGAGHARSVELTGVAQRGDTPAQKCENQL